MEYCPFTPLNDTSGILNSPINQILHTIITPQMLEQHESIQTTMDIKQELLQSMEIPVNIDTLTSSISGELTKHRELIKKSTDIIKETMKSFQEQQDKVLSLEKKYKDNIEQTSRDIEIIETFTHFIMKTREKYIDVDITR